MPIFIDNTAGPDNVGGFFPDATDCICINRDGATIAKGELVMLDFTASATEVVTSDSNSYKPGAADNNVFNTIIAVGQAGTNEAKLGTVFGVAMEAIADNEAGRVQFFGVVEEAFVLGTNGSATPGQDLYVAGTTNSLQARGTDVTNLRVVAKYIAPQDATLTNRELKRIFLHNGIFGGTAGT